MLLVHNIKFSVDAIVLLMLFGMDCIDLVLFYGVDSLLSRCQVFIISWTTMEISP